MPKLEGLIDKMQPKPTPRSSADAVDALQAALSREKDHERLIVALQKAVKRLEAEVRAIKAQPLTEAVHEELQALKGDVSSIPRETDFSALDAAFERVNAKFDDLIGTFDRIRIPEPEKPDLSPILAALDGQRTVEYDDTAVMAVLGTIQQDIADLKAHEAEPESPSEWNFKIVRNPGGYIREVKATEVK